MPGCETPSILAEEFDCPARNTASFFETDSRGRYPFHLGDAISAYITRVGIKKQPVSDIILAVGLSTKLLYLMPLALFLIQYRIA
jgi:hypothetical protein